MDIKKLQSELAEATDELSKCKQEENRLKYHMKHLKDVINDRKQQLRNLRRNTLVPVTMSICKEYVQKDTQVFDTLQDALKHFKTFEDKNYENFNVGADFAEDDFGVCFSMDFKLLDKVIHQGKVQFVANGDSYWNSDSKDYESPVLESPTYFEALQYFHQSIYNTRDKHHIFMEGVYIDDKRSTDDVAIYYFATGS